MNFNEMIKLIDGEKFYKYKSHRNNCCIYGEHIRSYMGSRLYIYKLIHTKSGQRYNFIYVYGEFEIKGNYNDKKDINTLLRLIRRKRSKRHTK